VRTSPPSSDHPHGEFQTLPPCFLKHQDKRPLGFVEICDWLLELPEIYGDAVFIAFGFNYDVTMLLKALVEYRPGLAYRKIFEICKKEKLDPNGVVVKKVRGHVYVGDYTIDWIKGKRVVIGKFRDPDNPGAGFSRKITIYDVYGFYQTGFVKVMESLKKLGLAPAEDVETIRRDKERRQNFDQIPLAEIQYYTGLELQYLSLAAVKLRDGFDFMVLRLQSWSGAGSAAAALISKEGVPKHYAGWVSKHDPSRHQLLAHAAYYGGHIELLRQGYYITAMLIYDIKSAYPSEMQELPSMIGGRFRDWNISDHSRGLDWREVETASKISVFFIRWRLPPFYVDRETGETRGVPFFPLPYRLPGGGILFSSEGCGWYMRDEAIAAKRWLEKFVRLGLPGVGADGLARDVASNIAEKIPPCYGFARWPRRAKDHGLNLLITEAAFFEEDATHPRPYAFIPRLYEERARLQREEPGNVAEQNIKLTLNSLSGKAAQSVGGSEDKPPMTACPWYAAATTAGTRRRAMEAALQNPHAIVQFATDSVASLTPLDLDIGEGLGQSEMKRVMPGTEAVFLQSGVYAYRTEDKKLPTVKARGFKTTEEILLKHVTAAWRDAVDVDPDDADTFPTVAFDQREFINAGSAIAGRARFRIIGRWADKPRVVKVHIPGLKRRLNMLRPELYFGTRERPARRCSELVETLPAMNEPGAYIVPSKPSRPHWLETGEIAFVNEFAAEEDEQTLIALQTM
jgi:hypothetical protein